jgi:hypothetical protein
MTMTNTPANEPPRQRTEGLRGHIGAVVALVALAAVAIAWWYTTRQVPVAEAGYGLPHGVIVGGIVTFLVAVMAEIRAMSFWDVLEFLWEIVLGVFWLIGAILKGIWNFICGLFGWN